ncbi:MAG: hypothetical protein ACOCP8_06825 [archaeon]
MEKRNVEEIRLEVGYKAGDPRESDDIEIVSFMGEEIANMRDFYGELSSGEDRGTEYTLYLTKKGRFLLHKKNWSNWQGESSTLQYKIFDKLEEIKEEDIPKGIIKLAKESMGMDPAEKLDL